MTGEGTRRIHRGDLVLKIYGGTFAHDSRDRRELETIREVGLRAAVLTKGRQRDLTDDIDCAWKIVSTRPLGEARWAVLPNRVLTLLVWAREARRMGPAVISGHDLIGTLIGWLSTLFMAPSTKPILIYDQHEFIVGLYFGWRRRVISALEGFLMRRSARSIAVNDSIADRMRDTHRNVDRPVVVRSMPRRWTVDESVVIERRRGYLTELGLGDDLFLMMYHGVVCPDRGVESLIRVLAGRELVALVLLGHGDPGYLDELNHLARELGVDERLLVLPSVPLDTLAEYVAAVDVGMVTIPNTAESRYLMLPNKFFENVQAGTPVIASDFPEVGAIVRHYDLGLLVDPSEVSAIAEAVDRLRGDTTLCTHLRENVTRARVELCWENEQQRLIDTYLGLMADEPLSWPIAPTEGIHE